MGNPGRVGQGLGKGLFPLSHPPQALKMELSRMQEAWHRRQQQTATAEEQQKLMANTVSRYQDGVQWGSTMEFKSLRQEGLESWPLEDAGLEVFSPVKICLFSPGQPPPFTPGSRVVTPTAVLGWSEAAVPVPGTAWAKWSTWEGPRLQSCLRVGSVDTWSFLCFFKILEACPD